MLKMQQEWMFKVTTVCAKIDDKLGKRSPIDVAGEMLMSHSFQFAQVIGRAAWANTQHVGRTISKTSTSTSTSTTTWAQEANIKDYSETAGPLLQRVLVVRKLL